MLVRWVIKDNDNGLVIDYAETQRKAYEKKISYQLHCVNQDVPYCPKVTIEKEIIN